MFSRPGCIVVTTSRPSRARELKLIEKMSDEARMSSRPSRARELKPAGENLSMAFSVSRPSRARELKHLD